MAIETKKRGPSSPSSRVGVEVSRHGLKLHDPEVFGPGGEELCGRFLRRVFSVEPVRSVSIDRDRSMATVTYDRGGHTMADLLQRMAAAIRGSGTASDGT